MNEMMTQMIALPPGVRLWTAWMMAVFFFAAIFVRRDEDARLVLGSFILTMAVAMLFFWTTGTVKMIAAAHLLVWTPLLVYLLKTRLGSTSFKAQSPAGTWLIVLTVTITISLVFDAREAAIFLRGVE